MNATKQNNPENMVMMLLMQENFQLKQQLYFVMSKLDPNQQKQMIMQQMAPNVFPGQNMSMAPPNPLMLNQMMSLMQPQNQMMLNPQMFMAQMASLHTANSQMAPPNTQASGQMTPQESGYSPPSQTPQIPNFPMLGMMPANMMMPQVPMAMFPTQMPVLSTSNAPAQAQSANKSQNPVSSSSTPPTAPPAISPQTDDAKTRTEQQERKRSHPETTQTPAEDSVVPKKISPISANVMSPQFLMGAPNSSYMIDELMSQSRNTMKDNTPRLPRTVPGRRQAKFCKICNQDIGIDARTQGPQRHIIQKHLRNAKLYACGYCDYASAYDSSQVSNHIKCMHPNKPKNVIDQKHKYQPEIDRQHELCFGKPSKHSKESSPCSTDSSSELNSSSDSAVKCKESDDGDSD